MAQAVAITSGQMWAATAIAGIIDVVLAAVLTHALRPPWRAGMALALLVVCVPGFAVLFGWASRTYWDSCYRFALPAAAKPLAPLVGAMVGALGYVLWKAARPAGRWTVPLFVLLGGFVSLPGHLDAIYHFDLLRRCPVLRTVSPPSALFFGVFEFGLYWSVALAISSLVARAFERRKAGA